MDEIKCEVIRDLLPLYEDNAASEETQELVRKHLKDCPTCREELRKMRTPISIPPEDDGDLWEKYTHRRAKLRRKRNIKIGCILTVMAVLVVLCLCYTLIPKGWDDIVGKTEPDRIMGTFIAHAGSNDLEHWGIDQETGSPAVKALMDALRDGSYRAELSNLMNYIPTFIPQYRTRQMPMLKGTVLLYLVKDNAVVASIFVYGTYDQNCIADISFEGDSNTFIYHANGELYDTLIALVKEYGEYIDETN